MLFSYVVEEEVLECNESENIDSNVQNIKYMYIL